MEPYWGLEGLGFYSVTGVTLLLPGAGALNLNTGPDTMKGNGPQISPILKD